ncbi:MAG: hypothetical protein RSE00_01000, partial [Clostridia bacterium]
TDYNATNKIVISSQGTTNVIARTINTIGVTGTNSATYVVRIDKSTPPAPTISGTVGNGVWTNGNVTLTIAGSSAPSGIVKYQYSTNGGGTWTDYNATNKIVISSQGTTNVIARAVNAVGATGTNSAAYVVRIDTAIPSAPTISGTVGNGSWTNGNVTLTISSGSAPSGILKYQYSTNNGSNWTDYNSSSKIVVSGQGTTNVIARAVNTIGATGANSATYVVRIDTTDPTTTIAPNGGVYTIPTGANVATIRARITGQDTGGSGLGTVQYAWSNVNSGAEPSSWTNYTASGQDVQKTDATVGTYYLWTRVVDNAGNRAESIKSSSAYIVKSNTDSTTQITITTNPTTQTSGNVTATITYGSTLVNNRLYGIGSPNTGASANPQTLTLTSNGTIYAQATDSAGNKVSKTLQVTNIDKTDPVISNVYSGDMLYTDPTFASGVNSTNIYNNSGGGTVTNTRKAMSTPVGNYALEISTNGTSSPGYGGFYFATRTSANKVFISRIVAKIPVGSTIEWGSNAYGSGGHMEWLTSKNGTGNWQEYVCRVTCGTTGTFSSTNFYYLSGGRLPISWQVAYATVIDTTSWGQTNSIVATATDNENGVVSYGVNQSSSSQPTYINSISNSWLGMSKDDITANGTYYVWTKDAVGNISNKAIDVNYVDRTAPSLGSLAVSSTTNSITATINNATDSQSGVKEYDFYLNGARWTTQAGATYTFGGLTPGATYNVSYKVRDNVLNETSSGNTSLTTLVNAPTLSSTTTESKQITTTWGANGNASGQLYELEVSDNGSNGWTNVYSGTSMSYIHTGLLAGTTKYYRARTKNSTGVYSGYSATSTGRALYSPSVTRSVTSNGANTGTNRVQLSWAAVPGATSYGIYVFDGYTYRYRNIGNVTSYDSNATNIYPTTSQIAAWNRGNDPFRWGGDGQDFRGSLNELYQKAASSYTGWSYYSWIWVASVDSSGRVSGTNNSDATSACGPMVDSDEPNIPSAPSIGSVTSTSISVSGSTTDKYMTASYGGSGIPSSGYSFKINNSDSGWTGSSYTFSGLTPNTYFSLYIRAKDTNGNYTAYSSASGARTLANVPSSITATNGASSQGRQITVDWNENGNPGGTVYELEQSDNASTWSNIYTGTASSFVHTGLATNTTKYYRVRSKNVDGVYTGYSGNATGKTLATPSASISVTGNGVNSTTNRIQISWPAVSGATSYGLSIFDGRAYRYANIGNVTSFDSNSRTIYPTAGQIASWNLSSDPFRWGNDGTYFAGNINPLYLKANGSYTTSTYYTWIHIYAYDASGRMSGDVWNGALSLSGATVDTDPPNGFTPVVNSRNTNTISISGSTTDLTGGVGVSSYQYRINGGAWQNSATFSGLAQNANYTLQMRAIDANGNYRDSNTISSSTTAIPTPTITPSTTSWVKGNVRATISQTSGFTSQYSLDGSNWSDATYVDVTDNRTVYARYRDSNPQYGGVATYQVTNIVEFPRVDVNEIAKENSTINGKFPNGTNPIIPKDFAAINEGEALWGETNATNKGLVIKDKSGTDTDGNEFVWIPVLDFTKFIRTDEYRLNGLRASQCTEAKPTDASATPEVIAMYNSVETKKGFYIARYEAGKSRNNPITDGTVKPLFQKGVAVWLDIPWGENNSEVNPGNGAVTVSRKMYTADAAVASTLMYGVQYDAVLRFIEASGGKTRAQIEDSTAWGNHNNNPDRGSVTPNDPAVSGALPSWSTNNIYDLAGNVWELTMEIYSITGRRVSRSGSCGFAGSKGSVACRAHNSVGGMLTRLGFRAALYVK